MQMNRIWRVLAVCGLACCAEAQVRRSSRNPQPLTRQHERAATGGMQSGHSGLGVLVAPKKQEAPVSTAMRVTYLGPKSGWGIVKETSPYYAPDGKRLGTLPGGTLFTYNGVKSSSRNDVLVCQVRRGEEQEGPCLLDCTDVAGYEGDPSTLNPTLVQNLVRYFTLNGRVKDRLATLKQEADAKNPHTDAVRQTRLAYQASIEKAAALEREMNSLTGTRRSKALDNLRALKYEQATLKTQADQAAAAFKAWQDAHPPDPAVIEADPQLRAWRAELDEARKPVAGMIPKED